jgi:hypothetical protein
MRRQLSHLVINQRDQIIGRFRIARVQVQKETRYLVRFRI